MYIYSSDSLTFLIFIFNKIGVAINPIRFNADYLNSIKLITDIFYYDLNVYTRTQINTHNIEECVDQVLFLKKLKLPIYIGGGINNKNAKIIIDKIKPNGLDVSRGIKDKNNNISLIKLNEFQIILSAA